MFGYFQYIMEIEERMRIIQFEPENKYYQKLFIKLPFELYRDNPKWVPPLVNDMRSIFNRNEHGFYKHGYVQFLLAMDGDQPVGRLVMLNNFKRLADKPSKTGYFYLFESQNDFSIAVQLFSKGIEWAKEQKIDISFLGQKG